MTWTLRKIQRAGPLSPLSTAGGSIAPLWRRTACSAKPFLFCGTSAVSLLTPVRRTRTITIVADSRDGPIATQRRCTAPILQCRRLRRHAHHSVQRHQRTLHRRPPHRRHRPLHRLRPRLRPRRRPQRRHRLHCHQRHPYFRRQRPRCLRRQRRPQRRHLPRHPRCNRHPRCHPSHHRRRLRRRRHPHRHRPHHPPHRHRPHHPPRRHPRRRLRCRSPPRLRP